MSPLLKQLYMSANIRLEEIKIKTTQQIDVLVELPFRKLLYITCTAIKCNIFPAVFPTLQMKGRWESNIHKCLVPIYVFPEIKLLGLLFPKQNYDVLSPNFPTFMYLWAIYLFSGSLCLFCSKYNNEILSVATLHENCFFYPVYSYVLQGSDETVTKMDPKKHVHWQIFKRSLKYTNLCMYVTDIYRLLCICSVYGLADQCRPKSSLWLTTRMHALRSE